MLAQLYIATSVFKSVESSDSGYCKRFTRGMISIHCGQLASELGSTLLMSKLVKKSLVVGGAFCYFKVISRHFTV